MSVPVRRRGGQRFEAMREIARARSCDVEEVVSTAAWWEMPLLERSAFVLRQ